MAPKTKHVKPNPAKKTETDKNKMELEKINKDNVKHYDHLKLEPGNYEKGKQGFKISQEAIDYIKSLKRKITKNKINVNLDFLHKQKVIEYKNKIPIKKKDYVFAFFTFIDDLRRDYKGTYQYSLDIENSDEEQNEAIKKHGYLAICNECHVLVTTSSTKGASNLRQHFMLDLHTNNVLSRYDEVLEGKLTHRIIYLAAEETMKHFQKEHKNTTEINDKEQKDIIYENFWILINGLDLPHKTLEKSIFKNFVYFLNPAMTIPSKKFLFGNYQQKKINEKMNNLRDKMNKSRVTGLMADYYKSKAKHDILGLILYTWNGKNYDISHQGGYEHEAPHTADSIEYKIKQIEKKFDISLRDLLFTVTDEASNMKAWSKQHNTQITIICANHLLNTSVKHATQFFASDFADMGQYIKEEKDKYNNLAVYKGKVRMAFEDDLELFFQKLQDDYFKFQYNANVSKIEEKLKELFCFKDHLSENFSKYICELQYKATNILIMENVQFVITKINYGNKPKILREIVIDNVANKIFKQREILANLLTQVKHLSLKLLACEEDNKYLKKYKIKEFEADSTDLEEFLFTDSIINQKNFNNIPNFIDSSTVQTYQDQFNTMCSINDELDHRISDYDLEYSEFSEMLSEKYRPLKAHIDTRWTTRGKSLKSVKDNFSYLKTFADNLENKAKDKTKNVTLINNIKILNEDAIFQFEQIFRIVNIYIEKFEQKTYKIGTFLSDGYELYLQLTDYQEVSTMENPDRHYTWHGKYLAYWVAKEFYGRLEKVLEDDFIAMASLLHPRQRLSEAQRQRWFEGSQKDSYRKYLEFFYRNLIYAENKRESNISDFKDKANQFKNFNEDSKSQFSNGIEMKNKATSDIKQFQGMKPIEVKKNTTNLSTPLL